MEILSYPVGLLVGVIQITVAFSSGEPGGYLLLDGEKACDLTPKHNSCQVNLGAVPKIHRLDLASETSQGLAVKDTRWLNRGVLPAELRLVRKTNRCDLALAYAHPNKEKPVRLLVTGDRGVVFDGPPRQSLAVNCEGLTFLGAEVAFADGLRASSVLPLSQFSERTAVSVYPWHLESRGAEEPFPKVVGDCSPLAVERGEAQLFVVAEPFAVAKLGTLAGMHELPTGDWEMRERTASFRQARELEFTGPLAEPVAITLILAVEGFPRVEIPRARDWLQRLLLASEELSQRFSKRPRRLWDATALAGYLASGLGRRRVVWILSGAAGDDASVFPSASVHRYLRELNVPLVEWVLGAAGREGPTATKIANQDDLARAFAALDRSLAHQIVLWLTKDPLAEPGLELPAGYRRAGDSGYADDLQRPPEGEQASGENAPQPLSGPGSPPSWPAGNLGDTPAFRFPIPPGFSEQASRGTREAIIQTPGGAPLRLVVEAQPGFAPVFVYLSPSFVADESLPYWRRQLSQVAVFLAPRSLTLLLPRPGGFGLESLAIGNSRALDAGWLALARVFEAEPSLSRRRAGYLEEAIRNSGGKQRQARAELAMVRGQEERKALLAALASLVDWAANHPGPAWLLLLVDDLPVDPCSLVAELMSRATGEPGPWTQRCDLRGEVGQLADFLASRGYSVLGLWPTTKKPEARLFNPAGTEAGEASSRLHIVPVVGEDQELLQRLASSTGGFTGRGQLQRKLEAREEPLWAVLENEKKDETPEQGSRLSLGALSWAIRRTRPEFWVMGPLTALARGAPRIGELVGDVAVARGFEGDAPSSVELRLRLREGKEMLSPGPVRLVLGTLSPSGLLQQQTKVVDVIPGETLTLQANVPLEARWLGVIVEHLETGRWGGVSVPVSGP